MANRQGLTLTDGSTRYPFSLYQPPNDKQARPYEIKTRGWEIGDPIEYWKTPLHPWDGGLGPDKITSPRSYGAANADASNPGLIVPPPKLQLVTDSFREIRCLDSNGIVGSASTVSSVSFAVDSAFSVALAPGDIIIGFVVGVDADVKTIANSVGGMTALTQIDNGNLSMRAFWKTFDTLLGSDFTFTLGATVDTVSYAFAAFRGAAVNTIYASNTGTDSTSPYSTPSVTAVAGNTIVGMVGRIGGSITGVPSGWTEIITQLATDGISMAYKNNLSAGATTGDFTGGTDTAAGLTAILLTPASPVFSTTANKAKVVTFNSKSWTFDETGLYSFGNSNRMVREFYHTGITDIAVFNNELIIAVGYSTKIWKATAASPEVFSQASDNTYAGKLAVVGSNLWRSTSTTAVSSCLTTPLTLSNWGTSYTVGDTTGDINVLIDYEGALWVGKYDGFYTPDVNTDFWNQTPQLLQWPDSTNCTGAFVAKGYLWCPAICGLIRIRVGEAIILGPEKAQKRNYYYKVTNGIEWGEFIYLTTYNQATDSCALIKMSEDINNTTNGNKYIYHEILRLDSQNADFYRIGVNINTQSTPCFLICLQGGVRYIDMGYSTGRTIDDNNYYYGSAWSFQSGAIRPTNDLSVVTGLIGVEIVCDQNATESIDTVQYKVEEGSFTNMLTTQEGGGTMAITNTSGYATVTRYAAANVTGQYFDFYFAGSLLTDQYGTNRPEIREIYAFGYKVSKTTDIINMKILAEPMAIVRNGLHQGLSAGEITRLFRAWKNAGTVLTFELPDYEESRTTRGRIVAVDYEEINNPQGTSGMDSTHGVVSISLVRDDFANAYAA